MYCQYNFENYSNVSNTFPLINSNTYSEYKINVLFTRLITIYNICGDRWYTVRIAYHRPGDLLRRLTRRVFQLGDGPAEFLET